MESYPLSGEGGEEAKDGAEAGPRTLRRKIGTSQSDKTRGGAAKGGEEDGFTRIGGGGGGSRRVGPKPPTPKRAAGGTATAPSSSSSRGAAAGAAPRPPPPESTWSYVPDSHMSRLRRAERVLLAEEAAHGRFLRDEGGRLVPSWREERERAARDLGRDERRGMDKAARTSGTLAPFAKRSGAGHRPLRPWEGPNGGEDEREEPVCPSEEEEEEGSRKGSGDGSGGSPPRKQEANSGEENAEDAPRASPKRRIKPSAKMRSHKIGGELAMAPYPESAVGRKRAPIKPNREKAPDLGIRRKKRENKALREELGRLKEEKELLESKGEEGSDANVGSTLKEAVDGNIKRIEDLIAHNEKEIAARERQLLHLKRLEKEAEDKRRARELERKRRKLPPGGDDVGAAYTIEDVCATYVQKLVRGWQVRAFSGRYRETCERAASRIQAGIRGMRGRGAARDRRARHHSAVAVQRMERGRARRKAHGEFLAGRARVRAAVKIQKYARRHVAGRYVAEKRAFVRIASMATDAVSTEELLPSDLHDLADVVQDALLDGRSLLPSPSILGLIRIVSVMLRSDEAKNDTVAEYSRIAVLSTRPTDDSIDWTVAMKVLRRSSKLLRRLRILTMGPSSTRPRRLVVPEKTILLYRAHKRDPGFSLDAFEKIGKGSRAACQLLKCVQAIVSIHATQDAFLKIMPIFEGTCSHPQVLCSMQKTRLRLIAATRVAHRRFHLIGPSSADCEQMEETADKLDQLNMALAREKKLGELEHERWLCAINRRLVKTEEDIIEAMELLEHYRENVGLGGSAQLVRDLETDMSVLNIRKICLKLEEMNAVADKRRADKCHAFSSNELGLGLESLCDDLGDVEAKIRGSNDECVGDCKFALEAQRDTLQKRLEGYLAGTEETTTACCDDSDDTDTSVRSRIEFHTDAEHSEDLLFAANEECLLHTFVPGNLLEPKATAGPKMVLFSRDVPYFAKDVMITKLNRDLPGKFIRVNTPDNMGIDATTYQSILDAGQIVVTDVDMGVGKATRNLFLHGFSICKQVLLPSPSCACIVGSTENKADTVPYYGTSETDLMAMKDGELKRFSESANHLLDALQEESLREQMKLLGQCSQPPKSYVLIMEAVVVLLSPSGKFLNPNKDVSVASWLGTRRILSAAERLQLSLKAIDKCNIPEDNLAVLCSYLAHQDWPNNYGLVDGHKVMHLLSDWISCVVKFANCLKDSGGIPDPACLKDSFAESITVYDSLQNTRGHKSLDHAYNRMLCFLFHDTIVRTDTIEFEEVQYIINTCLGAKMIYIFVTENSSRRVVSTKKLELSEIDALLAPSNKVFVYQDHRLPPETQEEVFECLSRTFVLERVRGNIVLKCKRDVSVILRDIRLISGLTTHLTVQAKSTGDLVCTAYLPQFGVTLEDVVDSEKLKDLLSDADPHWEEEEIKSCDAARILRPVSDRLVIKPDYQTIYDMRTEPFRVQPKQRTLGDDCISLAVRTKGGPGRHLFSCSSLFSGVRFILTVRELDRNGPLKIQAYNPTFCTKLELFVSATDRDLCLNEKANGCYRLWRPKLLQRLSIQACLHNKQMALRFDRTIFKTSARIGGVDFVLVAKTHHSNNDESLLLLFDEVLTSAKHELMLSKSTLNKALGESDCGAHILRFFFGSAERKEAHMKSLIALMSFDSNGVSLTVC